MVFKGTITIEWNGLGQPLGSMVFQWFWGQATIGFDGLRWLSTIGPTMEWLHTIVEVYGRKYGNMKEAQFASCLSTLTFSAWLFHPIDETHLVSFLSDGSFETW